MTNIKLHLTNLAWVAFAIAATIIGVAIAVGMNLDERGYTGTLNGAWLLGVSIALAGAFVAWKRIRIPMR